MAPNATPDWRPIHCPYCRCWHEQPDAGKAMRLCKEYCILHRVKVALPQWDTLPKRALVVLDCFPELTEKA